MVAAAAEREQLAAFSVSYTRIVVLSPLLYCVHGEEKSYPPSNYIYPIDPKYEPLRFWGPQIWNLRVQLSLVCYQILIW